MNNSKQLAFQLVVLHSFCSEHVSKYNVTKATRNNMKDNHVTIPNMVILMYISWSIFNIVDGKACCLS